LGARYVDDCYLPSIPPRRSSDLGVLQKISLFIFRTATTKCLQAMVSIHETKSVSHLSTTYPIQTNRIGWYMSASKNWRAIFIPRSVEHTSELQSREKFVCRLVPT